MTRFVGDPVAGQALVAEASKWGGWAVVPLAPLLGALVDRLGPRKPGLAIATLAIALCNIGLWFAIPGGGGISAGQAAALFAALTVLFAFHELFHNALLIPAAGVAGAARASGLALAGGNGLSVLMLVGVLFAFVLPGKVAWPWLPPAPLWGLDAASGEPDRIVTLLVAATLVIGMVPALLLVPDVPRTGLSLAAAWRAGLGDLKRLVMEARGHRNALTFLAARMIYTDGLTAILIFGGLYAAGTMHWGTLQMIGYGIALSVAAVGGGLAAGRLDMALGPRRAVMLELLLVIAAEAAVLTVRPGTALFMTVPTTPLWDGPMFTTRAELIFLGLGCLLAIGVTAAYASSRTLLTRVAPPDKLGVFFGLYVLSGSVTMWLGPMLVETATRLGGSQAWGLVPVIGMLLVGLVILLAVRGGDRLAIRR